MDVTNSGVSRFPVGVDTGSTSMTSRALVTDRTTFLRPFGWQILENNK